MHRVGFSTRASRCVSPTEHVYPMSPIRSMKAEGVDATVPETDALTAVRTFQGPVLVDLDETLYLRNSTEDFIDSAAPRVLAAPVMKLIDVIAPWRWIGGLHTRDIWRVRLVLLLFPWTYAIWLWRCRRLAGAHTNTALLTALREREAGVVVATLGFAPIVRPLLHAMGCGTYDAIPCRLDWGRDRKAGKAALVERRLGHDTVTRSLVVTDSADDHELLRRCAMPVWTKWSAARFQHAFEDVYFPTRYTAKIKHPGGYALRWLLLEDLVLWVLAAATALVVSPQVMLALPLFFLSFWAIYEIGYMENDRCAQRYEAEPQLTPAHAAFAGAHFERNAWIYAGLFALAASLIASGRLDPVLLSTWAGVLAALRALYFVYNRVDKATRVWLYAGLQAFRYFSVLAVAAVGMAGVVVLTAFTLARWIVYVVYRHRAAAKGYVWPKLPQRTIVLMLILVQLGTLALMGLAKPAFTIPAAILLSWCAARSRGEIVKILKGVRWIAKKAPGEARATMPAQGSTMAPG